MTLFMYGFIWSFTWLVLSLRVDFVKLHQRKLKLFKYTPLAHYLKIYFSLYFKLRLRSNWKKVLLSNIMHFTFWLYEPITVIINIRLCQLYSTMISGVEMRWSLLHIRLDRNCRKEHIIQKCLFLIWKKGMLHKKFAAPTGSFKQLLLV